MFTFSGETDDHCLLMIYPAELKTRLQQMGVAIKQNTVFASKASLVVGL